MGIKIWTTATTDIDQFSGHEIEIDEGYFPKVSACETIEQSMTVIQAGIDQGFIKIL